MVVAALPVPLAPDADGVLRIGGTRVTLDTVVEAFRQGHSAETIADQYPSLNLADVYAVLGYYLAHADEVDGYLTDRRKAAEAVRHSNEIRFDPAGVRARLLARRTGGRS